MNDALDPLGLEPLAAGITAWLAPQERFEELRRRHAAAAGRRLSDLAYANPYEGPPEAVVAAIKRALEPARGRRALDLQYTPYGGATIPRRLVAEQLAITHDARFRFRHVVLTPGAMAALKLVFRALRTGRGGDQVLVPYPCWMDYPLYLAELGMEPVLVPLDRRTHRLDLDRIESAIGPRTRALVLSQPANPTGILYRDEELAALGGVLLSASRRHGAIALISDECHRDIRFTEGPFPTPLCHYPFTFVVHSLGKSTLVQGQRIGYVAAPPALAPAALDRITTLLERLCRAMGFCTPTALMQLALGDLLRFKPDLGAFARRRSLVVEALSGAAYELVPSEATFFLYPRVPCGDDVAFVERLAERGVLVLPAAVFHDTGHFRISLTASDEMIERALDVLRKSA
jgi:aspartate aminotransferase